MTPKTTCPIICDDEIAIPAVFPVPLIPAMSGRVPQHPKLYHILHLDRLPSVVREGGLYSDAEVQRRHLGGTFIGMSKIKARRRTELVLRTNSSLHVGDCVPFYFCPRSVMLYLFYKDNHPDLTYHGGQEPIVHLVFDMHAVIRWAQGNNRHWAFTNINAGTYAAEDFDDTRDLERLDWTVIGSGDWAGHESEKQAEFLVERGAPWELVERIGVIDERRAAQVRAALTGTPPSGIVEVHRDWYY